MKTISIDMEIYSSMGLQKSGVYRYAEAPDFKILLFGYSADSASVRVVDLACGEKILDEVLEILTDESVIKWAFNANFERVCLSQLYIACLHGYPSSFRTTAMLKSYLTNSSTAFSPLFESAAHRSFKPSSLVRIFGTTPKCQRDWGQNRITRRCRPRRA